jgi:NTE family protein
MARTDRHVKSINVALQGGGSHGAFTWGVLDRLLEDGRIWIEAISGTSAGAMNAVVVAQGMYDGQAEGGRTALRRFWEKISEAGRSSPLRRSPFDRWSGSWSLDSSPAYLFLDIVNRVASPYDINPLNINPLRTIIERLIDFRKVRDCKDMSIYISATNVETGRGRVFHREEITADVVMASACLPHLFQAVVIDGEPYWDGGYMGNPVLFPFYSQSDADDIVIVQINPIVRPGIPRTAREILNRVNEITFNSSLLRELRAVDFVTRLLDEGKIDSDQYRRMNIHMIEARREMRQLGASSKLNSEWPFLEHLFEIGRGAAATWIDTHFDDIGERSTVDVREMFQGVGPAGHALGQPGTAEAADE